VQLTGFGYFVVRVRVAHTGRNPQTGDTIKIKASKVAAFKAGKTLKEAAPDAIALINSCLFIFIP
jgi:DNA-binding protein HU-beta